jgi:coenzyme F420-reducing hydrogenase beta subunit
VPVLVTKPEDMAGCRGMRMGYAPLLALLAPARAAGHRRLAVIGIPCQVYALRALEAELGFERLYVIGTPCSDNTTTERFHQFLALLAVDPASITYLEFRADYHVELRFADGRVKTIPFLQLPISKLPADFFPLTCRTCVDYTNVLADLTVGYMGGEGEQWLLVRNARGEELLATLGDELRTAPPRQCRQAPGTGARLPGQCRARRRRAAAAADAGLAAPAGGLADAADRSARPGIRPRPGGDEGGGDGGASAAAGAAAAEIHGPAACLGPGAALWPGARPR